MMSRMLLIIAALGVATASSEDAKAQPLAGNIQVHGLSCPFCAYGLQKRLRAVPWITNIKIHIDAGRVDFAVKTGKTPDINALNAAVRKGGFTPKQTSLKARGIIVSTKAGAYLRVNGVRVKLVTNAKLRKLLKLLRAAKKKVARVEGPAGTSGNTTTLAIRSFKI